MCNQEEKMMREVQVTERKITMEPLLDARSISHIFGVSCKTLLRMTRDGEFLAPVRIGKRVQRWRLKDGENFLAAGGMTSRPGADAREECPA